MNTKAYDNISDAIVSFNDDTSNLQLKVQDSVQSLFDSYCYNRHDALEIVMTEIFKHTIDMNKHVAKAFSKQIIDLVYTRLEAAGYNQDEIVDILNT